MFNRYTSVPESLRLYHRVLVEEFIREWFFLADALAGRATARADFTDKLVGWLTLGIDAAPLPGSGVLNAAVSLAIEYGNDKRKESGQAHYSDLQIRFTESDLRAMLELAAFEACRRHQYVILTQLSEDPSKGIVPLAKAGVERMLEYIMRNRLPLSVENLVNGLIAGHSGAYVSNYFNTPLVFKTDPEKETTGLERVKGAVKGAMGFTGQTAEGVYGRSALLVDGQEYQLYALTDKDSARHKAEGKKSGAKRTFFEKIKQSQEEMFDYGYAKLVEGTSDPKYGYLYVNPLIVRQLYGHVASERYTQRYEQLSGKLQMALHGFRPSIVVINRACLESYHRYARVQRVNSAPLSLLKFVQQETMRADMAHYLVYEPVEKKDYDLSGLDLSNLILDDCAFMNCTFKGSLNGTSFNRSILSFSNFENVASAQKANFSNAQLTFIRGSKANFSKARFIQTDFSCSDLQGANLSEADVLGAIWHGARLDGISLSRGVPLDAIRADQAKQLEAEHVELQRLEQEMQKHQQALDEMRAEIQELMARQNTGDAKHEAERQRLIEAMQALHQEHQARVVFERTTRVEMARLVREQASQAGQREENSVLLKQREEQLKTNLKIIVNPKLLSELEQLQESVKELTIQQAGGGLPKPRPRESSSQDGPVAVLKKLKDFFIAEDYEGEETQDLELYNQVLEAHEARLVYAKKKQTHTLCVNDEPLEPKAAIKALSGMIASLKASSGSALQPSQPLPKSPSSQSISSGSLAPSSPPEKSNVLILTPPPKKVEIAPAMPKVNPQELGTFLRLVAEGEQGKAESMLKQNRDLALVPGDVTDLSKRTFRGITAFQYALWALDWHMWTMLLKYLPPEQAAAQAQQVETGSWVREHGIHANWQSLIDAQKKYLDYCAQSKWSEAGTTWVKQVGGAQLLLPAHVISEYCHPSRSFSPCPDFTKPESNDAWRIRTTDEGEWFTAQYNGGGLGSGFGVCRGGAGQGCRKAAERGVWAGYTFGGFTIELGWRVKADHQAVVTLYSARQKQRDELLRDLSRAHVPQRAAMS